MKKFICYSPGKEQFDSAGKSLGIGNDRAICYAPAVGQRRLYRSSYPVRQKGLKLKTFKTESIAQSHCDDTNQAHNDDFRPLEIEI